MSKQTEVIEGDIVEALRTVFDPEIPVNLYDMGLIYEVKVDEEGHAYVKMTLTSPSCPVAETLPVEVDRKVRTVEGDTSLTEGRCIELVCRKYLGNK